MRSLRRAPGAAKCNLRTDGDWLSRSELAAQPISHPDFAAL